MELYYFIWSIWRQPDWLCIHWEVFVTEPVTNRYTYCYCHVSCVSTAPPTATVKVLYSPPDPHYPGDRVILQCDISEDEDRSYIWFINGKEFNGCTSKTCSTILGHDTVQYSCGGRRSGRPQDSQQSPDISITVTGGLTRLLTAEHISY